MNPPQVYMCSPPWTLLPPHTIVLDCPSALAPSIQYHALKLDWIIFEVNIPKSICLKNWTKHQDGLFYFKKWICIAVNSCSGKHMIYHPIICLDLDLIDQKTCQKYLNHSCCSYLLIFHYTTLCWFLYWQADSLPLHHQGSTVILISNRILNTK